MVGRGSVTSHGAGLHITMDDGSFTGAFGLGVRVARSSAVTVGGGLRSSPSSMLITTIAGTHWAIVSTILVHATTKTNRDDSLLFVQTNLHICVGLTLCS